MGRLPALIAALWWGGVTAISFLVVPTLFSLADDPSLAGRTAAYLFSLQSLAVLLLATLLLFWRGSRQNPWLLSFLLIAIASTLVQEFAIAPRILQARASGESIRLWHSLGSLCILLQWAVGGLYLFRWLGLRQDTYRSERR